jgi:hypothetical protein
MAMTFPCIPDPPGRSAAFEPLLDELVAIFRSGPDPLATFHLGPSANGYQRCEAKRSAVGRAAG